MIHEEIETVESIANRVYDKYMSEDYPLADVLEEGPNTWSSPNYDCHYFYNGAMWALGGLVAISVLFAIWLAVRHG